MAAIIPILDFENPALDVYARLSENQLVCRENPEEGLFIAESALVIERALDAGFVPVSFLVETRLLAQAQALLSRCPVELPVYTAELPVLEKLTGYALTRGMLCAMRRPAPKDAAALLRRTSCVAVLEDVVNPTNLGAIFRSAAALGVEAVLPVLVLVTGYALTRGMLCAMRRPKIKDAAALLREASCVAVLEDVVNPTNLGAIFRSAAALGVEAVLLTPNCTDHLYRRAIRVSMGNVFLVPWAYLPDDHWQALLKEGGFQTVAMALREDARVLWDPALTRISKLAVVMGSEGPGLKPETIAACDYTVTVPMTNGVDSLNVAAASAVAFYQLALLRQKNR